jgi:photosystem II stability/assembly factor-like uncharacterized protein
VNSPEFPIARITRDSGMTWSDSDLSGVDISGGNTLQAVSCLQLECVAGGLYLRRSYVSLDAGQSWRDGGSIPSGGSLTSVSCLGPEHCVALAGGRRGTTLYTLDAGRTWKSLGSVGSADAFAISCSGGYVCIAVGGAHAFYSRNAGKSWAKSRSLPIGRLTSSSGGLTGVTCPSPRFCVAIGTRGAAHQGFALISLNGGRSWVTTS